MEHGVRKRPPVLGHLAHMVPLLGPSETWFILAGLRVQLFTQNVRAQAAPEA